MLETPHYGDSGSISCRKQVLPPCDSGQGIRTIFATTCGELKQPLRKGLTSSILSPIWPRYRHTAHSHVPDELSHVIVCVREQAKVNATDCCVFTEKEKRSGQVLIVCAGYCLARGVESVSEQQNHLVLLPQPVLERVVPPHECPHAL